MRLFLAMIVVTFGVVIGQDVVRNYTRIQETRQQQLCVVQPDLCIKNDE